MVAERVSQGHAPAHLNALSTKTFPPLSARLTMSMETCIPAFQQNMEAKHAMENFTAMVAAGIAIGRMLMPVGRQGLRAAWHVWDRATGGWKKVEDEEEIDIPVEIAEVMRQQQQQTGQQQQQPTIPNRKVKVNSEGQMAIYSQTPISSSGPAQSPELVSNFLAEFNGSSSAAGSCQFGPPTKPQPPTNNDHSIIFIITITEEDQTALGKRNSITDGQGGVINGPDNLVGYNWG